MFFKFDYPDFNHRKMKKSLILLLVFFVISCNNNETSRFKLTVSITPEGSGTASLGDGLYDEGTSLSITATANKGWVFVEWRGDISTSGNPLSFFMDSDKNLEAVFRQEETVVIFSINDQHGQIGNFSKIKSIIDQEKLSEDQVYFVCGGDAFSGNPVVDFYEEKGYPMVDLMNKSGMDISVLGNHEFDYGQTFLNNRIAQAAYPYICANVDKAQGILNDPKEFVTIEKNGIRICFLGLIENSSTGDIPLTHPKKVVGLAFENPFEKIKEYTTLEANEDADLLVLVSHCGLSADKYLATNNPFVDMIVGGHSHSLGAEIVNNIPIVQSGSNLNYLTKVSLTIGDGSIHSFKSEIINLSTYQQQDASIVTEINNYNNRPEFFTTIGFSNKNHSTDDVGCFYVDALRGYTGADLVFQNSGGVRASINYGEITPYEIFSIDPFGNGLDTYIMTVAEIKNFLIKSGGYFYYSGGTITKNGNELIVKGNNSTVLSNETKLKVGLNDYISNVNPGLFPVPDKTYAITTAEAIIEYLKSIKDPIDYEYCDHKIQY